MKLPLPGNGVHHTYCRLCDAHCGLLAKVENGAVTQLLPDRDNPHSLGHACVKGVRFHEIANDGDRVLTPLRRVGGPGEFAPVGWDEALDDIAERLRAIIADDGPDALAMYLGNPSAFSSLNMLYAAGFLGACGSAKLYSASSQDAAGQIRASELLFGAPFPFVIPDLPQNDVLFIFGGNPLVSNGSIMVTPRIREDLDAIHDRGRVVVFDPRRTETAAAYDHVAIEPGGDPWLLLAMIRHVIDRGLVDEGFVADRTTGFARLAELAARVDIDLAAELCGVPAERIAQLAEMFARAPRAATYGRVGLNRNPFATLANALHIVFGVITGKFGRDGTMGFGTRLTRNNGIAAHGGTPSETARTRIGGIRGAGGHLPAPMLAPDITEPGQGRVRALYTVAGNPVLSAPNGAELERALPALDLFFSLDIYMNETNRYADYILPCTTFLERQDVATGHIGLMMRPHLQASGAMVAPRGEAREEHEVFRELCRRMGVGSPLPTITVPQALRDIGVRDEHHDIVDMMVRTSDIGDHYGARPDGITVERLLTGHGGVIAIPHDGLLAETFEQIAHADRRVHLCDEAIAGEIARLLANDAAPRPQFRLIGRRDIRTMNSWMHNAPRLARSLAPVLQIHPADAARIGVAEGGEVNVSANGHTLTVVVSITDEVHPGVVSYPHGFGHVNGSWRTANRLSGVNINQLASSRLADVEVESGAAHLDGIAVAIAAA